MHRIDSGAIVWGLSGWQAIWQSVSRSGPPRRSVSVHMRAVRVPQEPVGESAAEPAAAQGLMVERRADPETSDWNVIASRRAARPVDGPKQPSPCPFCLG